MTIMSSMRQAPEHIFAKRLAANDKKIRDKAVKKLRQWFSSHSGSETFSSLELLKIWKGLFYCMYMSDKPLIQEELSENIAGLIHAFGDSKTGLEFFHAGLQVISSEWNGLDKWRMDKFMMFLRRLLRHSLMYVAKGGWSKEAVELLAQILSEEVINANANVTSVKSPLSVQVQFTDMLLEELAKVGGEKLDHETIMPFIQPFIDYLAFGTDPRLRDAIKKSIFYHLINQSDVGIAHQSGLTVDELKEAMQEAEEAALEDQPKDPRAGKVDIALPQLRPDYDDIASKLMVKAGQSGVKNLSRKFMYKLVENFKDLCSGVYPLNPVLPEIPAGITHEDVDEATEKYLEEEEEMKRLEREERKKIRKMKLQEKKAQTKETVKQVEEQPVPKSNKQLKKEKRKAEVEEKIAKKRKRSADVVVQEVQSETIQNHSAEPVSSGEVPAVFETVGSQKTLESSAELKDNEEERQGVAKKEKVKKVRVPKNRVSEDKAVPKAVVKTVAKKEKVKKVRVPKNRVSEDTIKAVPKAIVKPKKVTMERTPLVELAKPAPADTEGPVIRIDLKPKPQPNLRKRKIEFCFDDNVTLSEAAIERAIKKTKTEGKGGWVPGVKTMQALRRQSRIAVKKVAKPEKVAEKPEELIEDAPFTALKKQLKEKRSKAAKLTSPTTAKPEVAPVADQQNTSSKEEPTRVPAPPVETTPPKPIPVLQPVPEVTSASVEPPKQKAEKKDVWNDSLQEGEVEIIIPSKKYSGKYKLKAETKSNETKGKKTVKTTITKSSKVKFVLQKNIAQDPIEYLNAVKTSPGIPHDPNKKPKNGVLKLNESSIPPMPSFEKKKKKSPAKFMTNVAKRKFVR